MADPELEAIRQRRMQELMAQRGGANQQNEGQHKAQEDAKQEAEERRQMMLAQILSSEARERLSRIVLVKPDKARGVEDVLLRAAQTGGISEKAYCGIGANQHSHKQTNQGYDSEAPECP